LYLVKSDAAAEETVAADTTVVAVDSVAVDTMAVAVDSAAVEAPAAEYFKLHQNQNHPHPLIFH
jgi:hypothetical protein